MRDHRKVLLHQQRSASDLKLVSPHLLAPSFRSGLVCDAIDLEDLGYPVAGSVWLDKMTGKK